MEIDDSRQVDSISSPVITTIDGQKSKPKAPMQQTREDKDDENGNDSDSDSITCPLFMIGLPKDFATNPQLAAIASLLNEDGNKIGGDDKDDGEQGDYNDKCSNNSITSSHQNNALGSTPRTTTDNTGRCMNNSSSTARKRNRRRQQRASPYPRQSKEMDKQPKATGASVGEITLFMNMWKP